MNKEVLLVALGGLLHDIGKFKQRGVKERKKHQEFGYEFLKKYAERHLIDDKLPLFARYHHRNDLKEFGGDVRTKNLLYIVCEADNISSGERKKVEDEDFRGFSSENPLVCLLSSVNIGKGDTETMYYPLREFSTEKYFYPVKSHRNTSEDYKRLFESFEKDFENAVKMSFNALMSVLEKYTTFIPAMLTENNDISLYDHLRTTSAIALCLYYYHLNDLDRDIEREIEDREERKYLIIGGDVSGIQDFIYTITSKGALKYLRARSLFIELLVEDVVQEIIERLELTRANVLYAGGGKFYILAPNTASAKEKIKEISQDVNSWLFERFWTKLYLAIDYLEVSGEELSSFRKSGEEECESKSLWREIGEVLKKKKLKKFLELLSEGKIIENYIEAENYGECEVCKSPEVLVGENGERVCRVCNQFKKLGGVIPKTEGFVRISKSVKDKPAEKMYEMPFSYFYPLTKDYSKYPEGSNIFLKHIDQKLDGLKGNYDFIPLNVSDYYAEDKDGNVKEFDDLAKAAIGPEKLAVLRMDVDDLGKVFSMGLENPTISRMATLSRFLNHFFKNCIDLICGGEVHLTYDVQNTPRLKEGTGKREVVVVYSGGDDLFIVGAWNDVFELAFEISDAFKKYVGGNPNLTISAGYAIFDPKFPLYRMAEITGEREEKAKDEGVEVGVKDGEKIKRKGRIFVLDRTLPRKSKFNVSYTWEEFKEIWSRYIPKIYDENRREPKIPRGALRRILEAREEYLKNPKGFRWQILLIYYLSRVRYNGKRLIEEIWELAERDAEKAGKEEPQEIFYIDVPLRIVDFAVRGGG